MANDKTQAKNPASVSSKAAAAFSAENPALPDFTKWSKLQIGFAPYWHPEEGRAFFGELVNRDDRDPEFVRFLIRSLKDEVCRRGPNNDDVGRGAVGEEVAVAAGETFSVSVYYSLATEFDFHRWLAHKTGKHVPMFVTATKKVRTKSGQDCWQWEVRVAPESYAFLNAHRDEYRRLQAGETEVERQIEN